MNEKVLQAVIKLKDQISAPLQNVNKGLKNVKIGANSLGKAIKENEADIKKYEASLEKAERELSSLKGQMQYTANKAHILEKAIKDGKDETGELAKELKQAKSTMSDLKNQMSNTKSKIDNYKNSIKQAKNNVEELKNNQNALSRTLNETSGKIKDVSDKLTDMGAKLTVTGAAITGTLTALTGAYVEQGAEINKISKMAGMSTKSYQQWDKMLKSTGYSMEQANGDFAAMAERMAVTQQEISGLLESESDLTQIVKQLGLSVTDSNGELKETGTFMNELMLATSKLENKTHQQAVMTALLSTTGEELLPHLDNWAEKAKELEGYSYINETQLQKTQQFKDKWNELKGQLDLLKNTIAQALLPVFEDLMAKISPVVEKITTWISENPKAVETLLILGGVITGLGVVLTTLGVILGVVATAMTIVSVVSAPVTLAIIGITLAIGALIAIVIYLWVNWEQIWSWISQKTSKVIEFIKSLAGTVGDAFSSMWEGIKNAFETGINWVKEKWEGLKSFFTNNPITAAVKTVSNAITGGGSEGQRSAWGTKRVVGNDVPYRLHDGERVLTRTEADRYDRGQNNQGVNITINGLTVREEADITRIANKLVQKINQNKMVYAGGAY